MAQYMQRERRVRTAICEHEECKAEFEPLRVAGGGYTRFCSRKCASRWQKVQSRAEHRVGPHGRECTKCRTWYPWSAFKKMPSRTYYRGRSPRCYWCSYHHDTSARGPMMTDTLVRTTRASIEPHGYTLCGSCGINHPFDRIYDPETKSSGQRTCRFCAAADGLRRNGGVANVNGAILYHKILEQEWKCACCGDPINIGTTGVTKRGNAAAHHCHTTKTFLDWLCTSCNIAEGHIRTFERASLLAQYMMQTGAT